MGGVVLASMNCWKLLNDAVTQKKSCVSLSKKKIHILKSIIYEDSFAFLQMR